MPFGGEREELLKFGVGGEGVRCQVGCRRERLSSLGSGQFLDRQPWRRPDEGPVRQLDAGMAAIASEGVAEVAAHLRRFTGGGSLEGPERAMLGRLASIAVGDMKLTSYDLNFYTHELTIFN